MRNRSLGSFCLYLIYVNATNGFFQSSFHTVLVGSVQGQHRSTAARLNQQDDNNNQVEDNGVQKSKLLDSPLSHQLSSSATNDENDYVSDAPLPFMFTPNQEWLETTTEDMFNQEIYPLGKLTEDHVQCIVGLMAAWVRRRSVRGALQVEKLLKRVVDDLRADNTNIHVSARMYTYAIDAWAKSGENGSAYRAQNIHDAMVKLYDETGDPLIAPSVGSYNTLLNAWGKSSEPESPAMAERVLAEMIEAVNEGNPTVAPNAVTFSTLMDTYAKSNVPGAPQRCEELFALMDQLGVNHNVYTFSALQNVHARSGASDAPEKTRAILDEMLELYSKGDVFARPNAVNYNAVLNALARTPSRASTDMAEDLLLRMELPVSDGGFDVEPDRLSYALVILSCSRCPRDDVYAANKAEEILEKMEARASIEAQKREEVSSAAPAAVRLDLESFNVVLTTLSKCQRLDDAPERVMNIIRRMENYAEQGEEGIRPNVRSWNAVLNTFARASKTRDDGFARKAEDTLNYMYSLHKSGVPGVKPDAFSFAAVLSAYGRQAPTRRGHKSFVADAASAQRADDIVRSMEELYEKGEIDSPPDVYHYTILCGAWAKSRHDFAAERCVQILTHMVERDQAGFTGVRPNVRTYNAVLDCLARAKEDEKAELLLGHMLSDTSNSGDNSDARPDCFSFNSVIHAIASSRRRGSGRRAEAVLDRFLEYCQEENPSVKPDTRSFTYIILHYGRSRDMDAPYRAEYILNRMVSLFKEGHRYLSPTNLAFETVMNSYSFAQHPDAGKNAERLLKLMRELKQEYGASRLLINTSVMNNVLVAWASCGDENAGLRAELHLNEMEQMSKSGEVDVTPTTKSYGLVLSAWSKSNTFDKARRALEVLRRMQDQQKRGKPVVADEYAYSVAINTCAFNNAGVDSEAEAFHIAVKLFDELLESESLNPSSLTYGWFIQACGRLRVPARQKHQQIEKAFKLCCKHGLVNGFVLKRFRGAAPEAVYKSRMKPVLSKLAPRDRMKTRISLSQLPTEWTRNSSNRKEPRSSWWESPNEA